MRRLPPHGKEKCGSPRVTLRLHQLKEKKDKGKANQMSSEEFSTNTVDSNAKGNQPNEEASVTKEVASEDGGNVEKETTETSTTEPSPPAEPAAPVKRTHSVDEDEDGKKKRRKEDTSKGKSGSNSGGSPKSLGAESEGEDAKSVESPGPKVPPLKIVIGGGSLEETGSGGRNGKAGSGRHHLPYVVASSTENEGASPPSEDIERTSSEETTTATTTGTTATTTTATRGAHQRVLRSHRVKKNSNSESRSSKESNGSGNSSPANAEGSPRQVSPTPVASDNISEEEKTSVTSTNQTASVEDAKSQANTATTHQELHPRKRKIRPRESNSNPNASNSSGANANSNSNHSETDGNGNSPGSESTPSHREQITSSFELFLNIRKQIERKRKGLFPVQPKPPHGFKDYLMNRCTYVLANNANNRVPPPSANPPASLPPAIRDLFIAQEKERHKLLMQHVIEKEKLVLSVEQEILRVHGRAARALANQSLPFSACTILRDEEVYSAITPEQEEKDRNARSRYNGRLFLSWLQDVDDKWEKIKETMLVRHHNEANSLLAIQKMDWEWKMKEIGLCELKVTPVIDETHVPLVHVSDDFDLLPD